MVLLNCIAEHCPEFVTLRGSAELLNPYARAYRYPAKFLAPAPDEFAQALAAAESIVTAVRNLIG